jgi:hypothetical protein
VVCVSRIAGTRLRAPWRSTTPTSRQCSSDLASSTSESKRSASPALASGVRPRSFALAPAAARSSARTNGARDRVVELLKNPRPRASSQGDWARCGGNRKPRLSGASGGADEGTRTLDLLHGKCERSFAPVPASKAQALTSQTPARACSRLFAQTCCLRGLPHNERARPNPSERRTLPSLLWARRRS